MSVLSVIMRLATLILPSGHTSDSPPSDISAEDLQIVLTRAAKGDMVAQSGLGLIYANGLGVQQDYAKARQWYEQAAAQGSAPAQSNLGFLYEHGQGVPQDYGKARGWYEKAAAQSDAVGQHNLGVLYRDGLGMPQDYVRAYMWFNLAAASTGDVQKDAARNRDKVARRMTPAQVAEAQWLASQCQTRQFNGC